MGRRRVLSVEARNKGSAGQLRFIAETATEIGRGMTPGQTGSVSSRRYIKHGRAPLTEQKTNV